MNLQPRCRLHLVLLALVPAFLLLAASSLGLQPLHAREADSATPTGAASRSTVERADQLLEGLSADELGASGRLAARALLTGEPAPEDRVRGVLQVVLEGAELLRARRLRLTVMAAGEEGIETYDTDFETLGLLGARPWVFLLPVELPANDRGLAVVMEAEGSEAWAGALADWSPEPLEVSDSAGVAEGPLLGPQASPTTGAQDEPEAPTAITLVPPRSSQVAGSTRFETIVSDPLIETVEFRLDGELVETDGRAPFNARLELAAPARRQTVEVVALGPNGQILGRDELTVNGEARRFRISFAKWDHDVGLARIEVEAAVEVPADSTLQKVEIFLNELPIASFRRPPFAAVVPAPEPGPTDYVRAVATLADGRTIDTVELIAARGASERLDVNLVELYTVVLDGDGQPVDDLSAEDFEILENGSPRPVEGFGYGQDVPLLLGLVIDSSGSMDGIMNETKQAAGTFLGQVLRSQDKAFVVDFDTRPRLAQGVTSDIQQLFASFRAMQPEGNTAFYDSVVFALIQFGTERGRKALVVLTDGDDYRSRYSPRRAIQDAQKSGVPVYILGLGDEQRLQRTFKQSDLQEVAGKTGGKVFLVSSPLQLGGAYSAIERELRSQYLLTFYSPTGLSGESGSEGIEVRVKKPGLTVRTVVGAR
ncbi:MAG: VWA domain-containing protein [Acidobacteriota bacterium]|nr:VWA domain-containing protein [Acidobacteriota bacterium]